MRKKILSAKNLSYLKLAYEVHKIADPLVNQGKYSKSDIYFKFVVGEIPVCINIFRKMMKEDVSNYLELASEYKRLVYENYLKQLDNQRRKRIN